MINSIRRISPKKQLRHSVFGLFFLLWMIVGCAAEPEPTPIPTLNPELTLGQTVFTDNCAICHANTPDTVIRGPSLHGIAERASQRVAGQDTRTYVYNSLMRPGDFLVEGFEDIMPATLTKDLTGEELDAVVAYILTLK